MTARNALARSPGSPFSRSEITHTADAPAASASGDASADSVSISRDLEMSQFWQNRQARLQPAVPKESTELPGRKWASGFFSIGSTQKPEERPQVVRTISPAGSAARTKQTAPARDGPVP